MGENQQGIDENREGGQKQRGWIVRQSREGKKGVGKKREEAGVKAKSYVTMYLDLHFILGFLLLDSDHF